MQIQTRERTCTSRNSVAKTNWASTAPITTINRTIYNTRGCKLNQKPAITGSCRPRPVEIRTSKKKLNTTALMNIFNTVEFSVPFDRFIDLCYQHKFNRYIEIYNRCNKLGYHTRIIVLIIGPLGLVHNKFVNGLKVVGLTTSNGRQKQLQSMYRLVLRLYSISVGLAECVNECYCM